MSRAHRTKTPLTVSELVARLHEVTAQSRLLGDTVVVLCEDGREYVEIAEVDLDQDEDGAVILLKLAEERLFKFDELDEDAKEKAREWYRSGALDHEWWDSVYDLAVEAGKMLGIEIDSKKKHHGTGPAIYFNEHGAGFDGSYHYQKGALEKLRREWPATAKDGTACKGNVEMHEVAEALLEVQRKNQYKLGATISSHQDSDIRVDVWGYGGAPSAEADRDLAAALKSFAHWIHHTLQREEDYLLSDEQVDDMIQANEYTFTVDGTREG